MLVFLHAWPSRHSQFCQIPSHWACWNLYICNEVLNVYKSTKEIFLYISGNNQCTWTYKKRTWKNNTAQKIKKTSYRTQPKGDGGGPRCSQRIQSSCSYATSAMLSIQLSRVGHHYARSVCCVIKWQFITRWATNPQFSQLP